MTQVSVSAATNKTLESDKGAFLKELEEKEPGKYKALELLVKDFSPGEITPVFSKSAPAPSVCPLSCRGSLCVTSLPPLPSYPPAFPSAAASAPATHCPLPTPFRYILGDVPEEPPNVK